MPTYMIMVLKHYRQTDGQTVCMYCSAVA